MASQMGTPEQKFHGDGVRRGAPWITRSRARRVDSSGERVEKNGGAKLADDKPERWPHGWTHRSDAPTVIERWEKGRVEEGERVGKRGKKARKENG